jgi:hypothetical protein
VIIPHLAQNRRDEAALAVHPCWGQTHQPLLGSIFFFLLESCPRGFDLILIYFMLSEES